MPTATELVESLADGSRSAYAPDVEDFISVVADADSQYGYDNLVTIHGETVITESQTSSDEEIQVMGGRADKGFTKLRVAVPLFATVPRQGDAAVFLDAGNHNYVSAEVLRIVERIGNIWTLMIGEQSALDRKSSNIR